jgi:WD40 repeat protein
VPPINPASCQAIKSPGKSEKIFQVQFDALEPIKPDNAIRIKLLAMLGRGTINQIAWSPDGKTLAVDGSLGVRLYNSSGLDYSPRLLEGHDPGLAITGTEITTGSGVIYFTLSNDNLWPTGSYKVNIYLNGELETTVEFVVQ